MGTERSIEELYRDDPERADAVAFGRHSTPSRRGFLGGSGLAAMSVALGGAIPFAEHMPQGLIPAAFAQAPVRPPPAPAKGPQYLKFPGKSDKLVLLGERPLVAETPENLLDDDTTPTTSSSSATTGKSRGDQGPGRVEDRGRRRGQQQARDDARRAEDEVPLGDLPHGAGMRRQRPLVLHRPARGNQWTNGGAGCAEWTGVRVADVLKAAGVKPSAEYTGHYGADPHLSGDAASDAISRGVPIKKLMDASNLIVWAMNGQPLPNIHGGPLRLVVAGWPGSVSPKWLTRIWIRDKSMTARAWAALPIARDQADGAGRQARSEELP